MSAVTETAAGLALPVAAPASPYRGIEPFRVVDRAIFFGRSPEVRRLFRMVTIYRGVLLYGDSGSGKSSLVNAGFIPLAVKEGLAPERIRVQPRAGEEVVLERIPVGPGEGDPYLRSRVAPGEDAPRVVLSARELLARLKTLTEPAPAEAPDPAGRARPLLIFDQFEEFVTLFEEAPPEEAREARKALLAVLTELLRSETLPVKLLFVFREDYLAKLNLLFRQAPDLPDHFLRIAPLPPSALHDIIRGPFEKVTGLFARELPVTLAGKLEAALEARSEQGLLNLSEVQIACLQLWESAEPEKLFDAVKVEGLLSGYLEDALDSLPAELRDPAVVVLTRLVTGAGTRNVVSRDDITHQNPGDPPREALARAVDALEKTALVRREPRHDVYFYEIASEFLVPWIYRKRNERRTRAEQEVLRRWAYRAVAGVGVLALLVVFGNNWLNSQDARVRRAEEGRAEAELGLDAAALELGTVRDSLREARERIEAERAAARTREEAARAQSEAALAQAGAALAEMTGFRNQAVLRAQRAEQARDTAVANGRARVQQVNGILEDVIEAHDARLRSLAAARAALQDSLETELQQVRAASRDSARVIEGLRADLGRARRLAQGRSDSLAALRALRRAPRDSLPER
ncbi:MAG TPA: hypothetical protein VHG91_16530 [Longimicrobium sp.]|nr:hypothetical protein [Longimicrobium sp.]